MRKGLFLIESATISSGRRLLRPWLVLWVAALVGCSVGDSHRPYKINRLLMGTLVEITVTGDPKNAATAANAVADEIKRVEDVMSFHKQSKLQALNCNAGQGPAPVDKELFDLIDTSLRFARLTSGAFDPAMGPISRLWGFSGDDPTVPDPAEIKAELPYVAWEKIRTDPATHSVTLPLQGMALDLGGIAKGYALDRSAAVLKKMGVPSALVNAGGDIVAVGSKSPGKPWRIGIQHPRDPKGILAVIQLQDKVVVTSGDYERFIEKDGKRYHHILDPQTGYPAQGVESVTVIASDGVTADALATAAFVAGPEKGLNLLEKQEGVEGLLVDSEGLLHMTSGARAYLDKDTPIGAVMAKPD